ncbi:NAD(P)H-binding protein [Saccharopolyspora sp. NPDC050642]|uniref:NAD(P)H-binding protein n=1 Tax=Saccharopolyspora sp. NPDC050642 TaxID=3157099 RepID=UPI0034001CF5
MTADITLVLGATGKTGRLVADGLRARGRAVRAAARSAGTRFDWDAPETWPAALDGVRAVYVVTPMKPSFSAGSVASFVAAAETAGIGKLVLLSGLSAGYGSRPMLSREEPVTESALDWTILRPGAFQQNFASRPYPEAVRDGELRLPLGAARSAYIDVADIAEVAVETLTTEGHSRRIYELAGPRALSFPEVLEIISRETGLPVRYVDVPVEEWTARMRAAGVSDEQLAWSLETFAALRRGEYAELHKGVQTVLGREPRDFAAYAKAASAAGVWAR